MNKESLENKGYAIDMKTTPGWFFKNIAELTISKDSASSSKEEEYKQLQKDMRESKFQVTHDEDGQTVEVYEFVDDPESEKIE